MRLKDYQQRVVAEIERFLEALATHQASGNRHASLDAWDDLRVGGRYNPRKNGLGKDLPTFCIKVPTGGGKTLIATQVLGSIHRTIHRDRNGTGLVLWVVPSSQIYRDTLRRLRDRNDMYRLMLEHAVSRRIELWEKHEIARLSPVRLRDNLNILIVQLASTNRESKEQLKFFKDSGGNIVQHFPPETDSEAHRKLKEDVPNLDMLAEDAERGDHLVATSVGNLVRLCHPAVILDEGHKATSDLARRTIEGFNASIVVELSATPTRDANVICRVSGEELLNEEMIKLPLNIAASGVGNWKELLTRARDKRVTLAKKAKTYWKENPEKRLIRPIVLVQVERTGHDQRDQDHIHSEDVREYLIERLDIRGEAIAVKTSATDELVEHADLLDEGCPIEWIITKAALQEGWDCPFAYILVSLSKTGSGQSMTQLVGRILRQPEQERTTAQELNESYVYCRHLKSSEIASQVKSALEREGYEGDLQGAVVDESDRAARAPKKTIRIRQEFLDLYRRPFEGEIFLPRFCVKEKGGYERLDYYEHLISQLTVERFEYDTIDWPLAEKLSEAKDRFYRITLGSDIEKRYETEADLVETDSAVLAWLTAGLRFDFLGFKQLRSVVQRVYEHLCAAELQLADRLGLVKFTVRDHVERWIQEQVDKQTEQAFAKLFDSGRLLFYLECKECRFRIPPAIEIRATKRLVHDDHEPIAKSLFDYVEHETQNEYERRVALCLDRDANVLWWYRNLVGPENFTVQGYKRNRIYPDFVAQSSRDGKPVHRVIVIESKGKHLEGNPDTTYKRKVAKYFQEVGKKVTWQQLGESFADHIFRFQILDEAQPHGRDWQDELNAILAARD
jgi:type III restriction enzyme